MKYSTDTQHFFMDVQKKGLGLCQKNADLVTLLHLLQLFLPVSDEIHWLLANSRCEKISLKPQVSLERGPQQRLPFVQVNPGEDPKEFMIEEVTTDQALLALRAGLAFFDSACLETKINDNPSPPKEPNGVGLCHCSYKINGCLLYTSPSPRD